MGPSGIFLNDRRGMPGEWTRGRWSESSEAAGMSRCRSAAHRPKVWSSCDTSVLRFAGQFGDLKIALFHPFRKFGGAVHGRIAGLF